MRSKSPKPSWVKPVRSKWAVTAAVALTGLPSAYAFSVNPIGPNAAYPNTASPPLSTVYYLDTSYTGTVAPTFSKFAFSSGALITLQVDGADTTQPYIWVWAESSTSSTSYLPVKVYGSTLGSAPNYNGINFNATSFQFGLSLESICSTGQSIRGCSGGHVDLSTTTTLVGFAFHFTQGATASPVSPSGSDVFLQVIPQVNGPSVPVFPADPGFLPGDEAIMVDTATPVASSQNGSSPTFVTAWVLASTAAIPASPNEFVGPEIQDAVPYGVPNTKAGGFTNSDSFDTATFYNMTIGIQDSAGAVTFRTPAYSQVFATDIQGFLRESNCFIATASFRDGRAPGVMLLRHFRDEILARFDLGRDFIGWYYAYGPLAADWLLDHPIFRSVVLMALVPLQIVAWVALHPFVLLAPLVAFLALLLGFAVRGRKGRTIPAVFLLAAILAAASPKARASDQPYIDSLISELPKDTRPTAEQPQPYIDSLRKKMTKNADADATGYTEGLRKEVPKSDGSEAYTQKIQRTLPRESGSAIEDYRKGKQLKANKGSLDTRSAFGFDILAGATRTYTSGSNTTPEISYSDVYGDGWIPELSFHYEWRPFTSSFLKKFGLFTSLGASFTKAKGHYAYRGPGDEFPAESDVDFRFIAIPANVGLIYRFSVFDFMWPYFGGGPSVIGFTETRNDKQPGNHGYDLGYWFMGGVAFGLDWISPKSSWDQYESTGVKHSYFTIDYSYLESVAGGLIEFTVDGVRLGFTFEL